MRKLILAVLAVIASFTAFSQDFSNKGKEFWLAYSYHVGMVNAGGAPAMTLYLTSDVSTTYNVEIYGGAVIQTGTILPNQVVPVVIPNTYFINADGLFTNKAVHVTAAKPIVVYSFITRSQASAASLCLPTNVLGKEYYAMSFTQNSNEANACSYITIVAVEDNTTVEIKPTATTKGGWAAGSTNTITLNKGQVYQVLGTTTGNTGVDLSGTSVKAIALANEGCKRIAVFSGSGKIAIQCANGSADNLYQQLYPATSWGRKYLTVPSYSRPNNYFRVMKNDPLANVYVNGTLVPAASFTNGYYTLYNAQPNIIESDLPISVTQYFTSAGCPAGNPNPYDPDMIVLNPVEQNISKVTLISSALTVTGAHQHHLHIIMRNSGTGISSFKFDGAPIPPANWIIHPGDGNYSYVYIPNVSETAHSLSSDSGFNALAYGYGSAETYGYSAGTNVRDLYQQIGVSSQYGIETSPSVCTNSPFKFKVSLPYLADSLYWDLSALPAPTPPNVMMRYPPATIDSTTSVNGKTIYWYSLPSYYNITTIGTYPISITSYSPTAVGGCGTTQDIDFDLEVSNPPNAGFKYTSNGCYNSPVQFFDTTNTVKPTYKWFWNFGDGFTSTQQNPTHTYAAPGTYTVNFSNITTPGCLSDTVRKDITVTQVPSAKFGMSSPVCEGKPVVFSDTSIAFAPGVLTKWYWDFGDGFSIVRNNGSDTTHTYFPWVNTDTVRLIVETNSGCKSPEFKRGFKVNPNPVANFTMPAGLCLPNGLAQFNSTSTIADGTQAGFVYLWNFGDPGSAPNNTAAIQNPTHSYTGSGPFNINLKITSAAGCIHDTTKTLSNVFLQADGAFTAPAAVCLGTPMNFTSSSTAPAPSTVATYFWDFGDASPLGSGATPSHTYATANTFTVKHWIVTNNNCNSDTATATVTVNPVPAISNAVHTNPTTCSGTDGTITLSGLNAGQSYTLNYDKNSTPQPPATVVASGTGTIVISGLNAGTYSNFTVTALSCTSAAAATQVLTDPPLPPAPTPGSNGPICSGNTLTLTASNVTGASAYTWTGPNSFSSNVQNPTIPAATTAAQGTYSVTATVANCVSAPAATINVIVNPTPVITSAVVSNPTTCGGTDGSITLNGLTAGQTYTVNYTKNAVAQTPLSLTASAGGTVVISNLSSGTYASINVSLTGCTSANAPAQTLNDPSAPAAPTGVGSNTPLCAGAILNLTYSSPPTGATYTWSGPNSFSSTLQNPSIASVTTAATGNYNLSITVNNCTSAATTIPVVINGLPTANFTNATPSCETRTISFTDASVATTGTVNSWQWDFGDPTSGVNNTSTLQNPTHSFATANNYTVKLTVGNSASCTSTQFSKVITINTRPQAGFIIPEVCLSDTYAQFFDTSHITGGTITGWNWNFGDANANAGNPNTSTAQNPTHSYTAVGPYNVQLIVTTNNGCKDTITQVLIINGSFPTANFSVANAASLCANDSVAITNSSTVFPGVITKVEIYWDNIGQPAVFDIDNNPTTGKVYKHLYPNFQNPLTKNFTIRFRAYSGGVCVNDKLSIITVHAAPKAVFSTIPPVCLDQPTYQITQAVESGGVPGPPGGVFTGPGVSSSGLFTPSAVGVGTYTIKYTYTSNFGCVDTASQQITVLDSATANFSVSAARCEKRAITFTDNSTTPVGTLTTWTWNFGDGTGNIVRNSAAAFTHTFALTGTYNVTLKVTTSNGCNSTVRTIPVVVSPQPKPAFTMPTACLPNANVTFTNGSTIADASAMTYLWDFGDPGSGSNTSSAVNGSHTYANNGPFTVTLLATSNAGCDSSLAKLYSDLHPQPTADFTFADPAGVCKGSSTTFIDNSGGADGTLTNWLWDLGDGSAAVNQTGTSTPVTHSYPDTLVYNIKLSITNSFGCKNEVTKPFKVHAFPTVDAGPDRFVLEGGTITLQPTVTGLDLQYLWLPGTFLNNDAIATPTVSNVTRDMTYTLTVTAQGGCSTSDIVFVKLLKFPIIPNTFTPNNDGINDTWRIDYLDTYPDNRVQVFNRYGQLVFESHGYSKPWDGTYNGKPLPIGTYYYIIEPKNGRAPLTGYVTIIK